MRLAFLRSLLALNFVLGCAPLLGMFAYVKYQLHGGRALVAAPDISTLAILAMIGVVVPIVGLAHIVRRVAMDRTAFHVVELCAAYLSLAVVFAGAFFLLQAASMQGAITGMTQIWAVQPATSGEHLARMLAAFGESAYLSVTTLTTLGYGDLVPRSGWARFMTATESLAGVGFVGIVIGHYFSFCTHRSSGV